MDSKKECTRPLRQNNYLWEAFKIKIVSSTYEMIGKFPLGSASMGKDRRPCVWALFIMHCNRFDAITKRSGERGSPCLTPLLHSKYVPGVPFSRIEDVHVSNILLTHWVHFSLNPKCCNISRMHICSIVSKSFFKI